MAEVDAAKASLVTAELSVREAAIPILLAKAERLAALLDAYRPTEPEHTQ
jgi:hypothetical protein